MNFVHLNALTEITINLHEDRSDTLSGLCRSMISNETEFSVNFIGFGGRTIVSVEFDKIDHILSVKKTWSFFSDKIKILLEDNGHVFFLNTDNLFCVTNSKNQTQIRVLSDIPFNQAIIQARIDTNHHLFFGHFNELLIIYEIRDAQIVDLWEIETGPTLFPISVRGKYVVLKCRDNILAINVNDWIGNTCDILRINPEYITVDIIDRNTFLAYYSMNFEGRVITFETSGSNIIDQLSFFDSSLTQSTVEFGRYLCISGKTLI